MGGWELTCTDFSLQRAGEEAVESWQGLPLPKGQTWTAILALMKKGGVGSKGNGIWKEGDL